MFVLSLHLFAQIKDPEHRINKTRKTNDKDAEDQDIDGVDTQAPEAAENVNMPDVSDAPQHQRTRDQRKELLSRSTLEKLRH